MTARPRRPGNRASVSKLLAAIVDSSDDAILSKTLDGIITSWNKAAERIYGYQAAEIIGRSVSLLIPPDRPDEMAEILDRIRIGERVDHYETTRRTKDGATIAISLTVSPIHDADGGIVGASSIARDITERERAQEQLRSASEYARRLIEASLDPLVTISAEGKITDVNEATIRVTGVERGQLVGTDFSDYFTEPDRAREGYRQVFAQGFVTDYPLTIRHTGGGLTDVLYNASVYKDEAGHVLGAFAAARDVTAQRRAESEVAKQRARELEAQAQIQTLNAELEARVEVRTAELVVANKNLEAFTYSVAHDLRSPLRALSGYSEALTEDYGDRLDETGRWYAERIQAATDRMGALIDDLLVLAQVSRTEMSLGPVDLSAEVAAIAGELQAREPGRRVRFAIHDGVWVNADRTLIRTVLQNLVENAWKYTGKRDGATIEFGATAAEDAGVCCYVRDNGTGFDPAFAGKLSSRSSGSMRLPSSLAPASAWPASGGSSNATAGESGPKAPSAAAPPSTSPWTRKRHHDTLLLP